jgi:hypothetical protein
MEGSPKVRRDDFDWWIGWLLVASYQDLQPPERVWQRIVRCIAGSDETDCRTGHSRDGAPGVVVGARQL